MPTQPNTHQNPKHQPNPTTGPSPKSSSPKTNPASRRSAASSTSRRSSADGSAASGTSRRSAPAPSIFTKIINGEIPCYKIYEDTKTFAFLDINPETKGHTLVVPKLQVDKLYDLPDDDYLALMRTAKKLSKHLEAKTGARTLWKVVGTDVPHAHIHLEPLDETWTYGRHLSFTPAEFAAIQRDLAYEP